MKKKLLISAFLLLGLGAFSTVLMNTDWNEIGLALSEVTLGKLFLYLAVAQIPYFLFTWRWSIILSSHGHPLSFWKVYWYRAVGYSISTVTPTQVGGEPARIYFLNENHQIPLKEATASVLLDKLIEMSTFVAFVASGVLIVSFTDLIPESILLPVAALMGSFIILGVFVFKKLLDGTGFVTSLFCRLGFKKFKSICHWENKIHKTECLIADFLSHTDHKKTTVPFLFLLSLLGWFSMTVEFYLLAGFLGVQLSALQSFLIATLPMISYLMPVPAGIGMYESAVVGMFKALSMSTGVGFATVVLVRTKELLFTGLGFGYAMTHGVTLMGKKKLSPKISRKSTRKQRSIRPPKLVMPPQRIKRALLHS